MEILKKHPQILLTFLTFVFWVLTQKTKLISGVSLLLGFDWLVIAVC